MNLLIFKFERFEIVLMGASGKGTISKFHQIYMRRRNSALRSCAVQAVVAGYRVRLSTGVAHNGHSDPWDETRYKARLPPPRGYKKTKKC